MNLNICKFVKGKIKLDVQTQYSPVLIRGAEFTPNGDPRTQLNPQKITTTGPSRGVPTRLV